MLEKYFNPLNAFEVSASFDEVKKERDQTGESLSEVKNRHKAAALYSKLASMKYRTDEYEDKSDSEVLDGLLDILMDSVNL